eukprot:g7185.t1
MSPGRGRALLSGKAKGKNNNSRALTLTSADAGSRPQQRARTSTPSDVPPRTAEPERAACAALGAALAPSAVRYGWPSFPLCAALDFFTREEGRRFRRQASNRGRDPWAHTQKRKIKKRADAAAD